MLLLLALCLTLLTACGKTPDADVSEDPEQKDDGGKTAEEQGNTDVGGEHEEEPPTPTDIVPDGVHNVGRVDLYTVELSNYRIVIAKDAGEHVVSAAQALAYYVDKACGYVLEIVTDDTPAEEYEIMVGPSNRDTDEVVARRNALQNDGITYYVSDQKLYLGSCSEQGTEYAVYHFLEDWLGCRFYTNEYEVIHEASYIRIPKDLDYSYSSPLCYRKTDWEIQGTPLGTKLGLNGDTNIADTIVCSCHSLGWLSETGNATSAQPCLSDESVYQTVLKNVKNVIAENPGVRIISVTQNDSKKYCTCEQCTALAEQENQSGVLLTFINRLADEIAQEHPEVKILTFAYQYTRKPPVTIKPADNVIIYLCSIECCFSHALNDPDCPENVDFCADIEAWSQIAKQLFIWDYTTNYAHYLAPFPNLMVLRANAAFLTDKGATGIYEEGDYQQAENGEFSRLRAYLLAKVLWNPYMTEQEYDALLTDFLRDYYGAGYTYVYEYVKQTSQKVTDIHLNIYFHNVLYDALSNPDRGSKFLYQTADGDFDTDFVAAMGELWAKAIDSAESDVHRAHCVTSSLQQKYMELLADRWINATDNNDLEGALFQAYYDNGVLYKSEGGDALCSVDYLLHNPPTYPIWKQNNTVGVW